MNWKRLKAIPKFSTTIRDALVVTAILLMASFANASVALPQQNQSASFAQLAHRAETAMQAGHTAEATRLFRRAVTLRPNWPEGWWFIGTMSFDAGKFTAAKDAFVHFVSVEHKQAGPGFGMLGLCEFQLHHYRLSLNALERGRVLGLGENWDFTQTVLYHAGILYTFFGEPAVGLQRLTLAANRLAAAHSKDPTHAVLNNTALINAFGLGALRMRKLPSQISDSEAPLVQQAGNAQALIALQERAKAGVELKKIAALYPSHPGVHYMYGVYLLRVDPPAAIAQFKREIEISPSSSAARIQLAFEYLRTAQYQQGIKYAQKAVALAPKNFVARVVCGKLWLGLGKTQQALVQLKTAVRLSPDSPDARFAYATALAQAGKTAEATHQRQEFERLRKLESKGNRN